jgi:ADP-ribose pyrophosphatase YjhB (NUDIX family)
MKSFNVRVYGLLKNDRDEVLITDEFRFNHAFTKFPGGGLEFGEGLADGLKREFLEELALEIEVGELFFVNDFYQESAFNPNHQLLIFYFWVSAQNWQNIPANSEKQILKEDGEMPRWIPLKNISSDEMTFPVDKIVAEKLKII